MAKEKIKSLSLSKLKIAEPVEGQERRVTFVASSSNEDRDFETLDIGSFRLPKKGGGHILVRDLPAGGSENVDIPFLTNHDLWDVEKTIGSVRRASFIDGELIFEAGISSRDYAQDVFKLIEEGHLDNAFSIQFRDYNWNPEAKLISNGEIIEVSLVTRGSNKEAQVLEVKQVKGEEMATEIKTADASQDTQPATTATTTTAPAEQAPADTQTNTNTEEGNKEKSMHDDELNHTERLTASMKMPSLPSQEATNVKVSGHADYLKSKQAEIDFKNTIVKNYGQPRQAVMKAWTEQVRSKGITGDAILPSYIEQLFFKAWEDHYEQLGTFRRTKVLTGAVTAFNTTDRALGHRKGDKKAEQTLQDIRRDYKYKILYKKLSLDLQDLIDDTSGELLRLRAEELSTRTDDEIVRSAIFGDGRTAPAEGQPDYRTFDGTRGIWSMKYDLDNSATSGSFSNAVATVIANDTADNLYTKAVKTLGAVKGGAGRKILTAYEGFTQDLLLATKANGDLLLAPGTNLEDLLNAYIFESPYMTGSGYDLIAYRENSYLLPMGNLMVRTTFNLDYNTDVMLHERAVSGTLYGRKVVAGYASKA